jgi:hypothetical protein
MTPEDRMPDEHRYQVTLDWGPPSAEELRNRRRRVLSGSVDGPYRRRAPWLWRVMRVIGRWFGAQ